MPVWAMRRQIFGFRFAAPATEYGTLALTFTGSAHPRAVALDIDIRSLELVASLAARLPAILNPQAFAASDILAICHKFHVVWIDAIPHPTKMVNH